MLAHSGIVMTLANSIIGVGILAMPFCFQKCGIILSIVLLLLMNWLTRIACYYLIKSSLITRRKSLEFLGFHAFGSSGKLLVELCIIGYLLGTCITYFVVVGDLGPQIITKIIASAEGYSHLRTFFMFAVTILCILPLGMLKNVDSLSTVSTASIGFYICLVIKIILESETHILANDWSEHVVYWEPSGVLQCLPIFSMALSCQMQLFEIIKSVHNQSIEKLNNIVRDATWICTFVYIAVGFFGYVAFCTQTFTGNILMNFSPSASSDVIKIGFITSVVFSFPLVIFPCRASIYSLLFRKGHADTTGYMAISDTRFKFITIFIVCFALFFGLMIPSVELIIGLVGSTIGVAICVMFPAACFRKITKKHQTERSYSLSSFIIISGFLLMVLGTYANLQAIDEQSSGSRFESHKAQNVLNNPTDFPNIRQNMLNILDEQTKQDDLRFVKENPKLPRGKPNKEFKNVNDFEKSSALPPPQAAILPVDEVHVNVDAAKEQVQVDKLKSNMEAPAADLIKPQLARNNLNNSENELKPLEQPKVKHEKLNNFVSSEPIPKIKIQQQTIDKDAIKKDEEMAAEESKGNKANKAAEDELKKTQNELKKTKELLERKVDEIKEEIAKQNKETQNLVVEKLVEVLEKVEKIEREVNKKDDGIQSNSKIIKQNENVETASLQNQQKPEVKTAALESHPNSLLAKLTAPSELSKVPDPKIEKVYEPLSYKTGELIEQQRLPLPLALLINSSKIKTNDKEKLEIIKENENVLPPLQTVQISNGTNFNTDTKENKESIRRDILQLNTDKSEATVTTLTDVLSNSHQRIKRELEIESKNLPININNDCLIEPKIETLLQHGSSDALHLKFQGIGRDLKSLHEKNNEAINGKKE